MKRFNYVVSTDCGIIYNFYEGSWNLNEITSTLYDIKKDVNYSNEYSLLVNLKKSNFLIDRFGISKLAEHFKNNNFISAKNKCAFITNSPEQVVFVILLAQCLFPVSQKIKAFSIYTAAFNWLFLSDRINNPKLLRESISEFENMYQ